MSPSIGKKTWAIAEGYIPPESHSHGHGRELESHETLCFLNCNDLDAQVEITVYFNSTEPVGPYRIVVPARRTRHVRLNDLRDPKPIPRGTDFSSLIHSDRPIVVQYTRLDTRQAELGLLSTIAYPGYE